MASRIVVLTKMGIDDSSRYIEYLQEGLLASEWREAFDHKTIADWYQKNRSRLRKLPVAHQREDIFTNMERLVSEFEPSTRFETFHTAPIFEPILERVKQTAQRAGLKATRQIRIATSTEVAASPLARPTTDEHVLFIGPGTWAFCNYWAKAITGVIKAVALGEPKRPISSCEDLRTAVKLVPGCIDLAGRLALYYGSFGTVLGLGTVEQPEDHMSYRLQLLNAMETWVVAHEYVHFVAHERMPDLAGHGLETFCDVMGLQLSRNCSYEGDGWLGFTGVGAITFLRSFELCESIRNLLAERTPVNETSRKDSEYSQSHPSIANRIPAIKSSIVGKTADDQRGSVEDFIEEYDRLLQCLNTEILEISVSAFREH